MTDLNLADLDIDGAIRESAEDAGLDRGAFFRKAAVAGGGLMAGGALFGPFLANAEAAISSKRSKKNDVKILNYALTLEFLEAEFYKAAVANNAFGGNAELTLFAQTVAAHEDAHVKFLRKALGSAAIKKPTFDFGDAVTDPAKFAQTAQVLEDTGVAAYAGQGPNIFQKPVVVAALSIHSVEARHAAWIRFINGGGKAGTKETATPAPADFDKAKTEKQILSAVGATGFLG